MTYRQATYKLSVVICTYNPDIDRLTQTLNALRGQSLGVSQWELIIVDNNSRNGVLNRINLSWHPNASIIAEPKQGLTYSRIRGFKVAAGKVVVMVDDDNVLKWNYLEEMWAVFEKHSRLGAAGGRSLPLFSDAPPEWVKEFYGNLALRDLGERMQIEEWSQQYPANAPIGAGMGIRKAALSCYFKWLETSRHLITDRRAESLSSGGDNDLVLSLLRSGWQVGYFPVLSLTHLIPGSRLNAAYLGRLVHDTNKSWIQVLAAHEVNPWQKINRITLPFRKLKAYFSYQAWQNEAAFVRWKGACGIFEGLATLDHHA